LYFVQVQGTRDRYFYWWVTGELIYSLIDTCTMPIYIYMFQPWTAILRTWNFSLEN